MRKTAIFLLGLALAAGASGSGVRAMACAYSAGVPEESLSEEERQKLENWHKEEMRQQIAYLEKYGISYDADADILYYQGKTVRWLIDEQMDDTYMAIQMPEGEIDVYTERGEDYRLTGLRVASREEYDDRTRKDEDGSVIHTFTEENGFVLYPEDPEAESGTYAFHIEESISEGSDKAEGDAVTVGEENPAQAGETVEIAECLGIAEDDEAWRTKQKEYESVGITYDSASGCWMWQEKPVYFLMDENGSMYQNGSKEAKEAKIYILVTRNGDGDIIAARQITVEEALKEHILQENY